MPTAWLHLLKRLSHFTADDELALHAAHQTLHYFLPSRDPRGLPSLPSGSVNFIVSGFAARQYQHREGRRQILGFLMPGDRFDVHEKPSGALKGRIVALAPLTLVSFSPLVIARLGQRRPAIATALSDLSAVAEATTYQWLCNLGHRSALERTAHLFCELFTRMQHAELASVDSCELPLRQPDLADALAITVVHLNRKLQEIRRRQIGQFERGCLTIQDFPALRELAGFNSAYLGRPRLNTEAPAHGVAKISTNLAPG